MQQDKIYVGNLSYDSQNDDLKEFFAQYGPIKEVRLITDRETGRSRGFAFITFETEGAAQEALAANGADLQGHQLKVSIAREREDRGGRRGGNGGGNFRAGGGGGGGRRY